MDEELVREILKDIICEDNSLQGIETYISYPSEIWIPKPDGTDEEEIDIFGIMLDGGFTIEQLEAIVWWAKNKKIVQKEGGKLNG